MRELLSRRVQDGVIDRLIAKWLKAGVWEKGNVSYPEEGTPQGGVISPLLSNIYLHEVLDKWFVESVQPACGGRAPSWCDMPMTLSWASSAWRMFRKSSG